MSARARADRVWLVLPDLLSTRVFVDTGIVARLREALGERLVPIPLIDREAAARWGDAVTTGIDPAELAPWEASLPEKVKRRSDEWLDRRFGFFPLAVRLNYRHGFHLERMEPGHRNRFLDSARVGPLPRTVWAENAMARWYFSPRRYVPSALAARMRAECRSLIVSNIQISGAGRYLTAARRVRLPVVGYVASWDHAVGKGVMSPHLDRYIVQNEIMRGDLERYHGITGERVVTTGWPQSDVFHRRRDRAELDAVLERYGLDATRPVVLVTGNSPTNAPYEGRFVERLVRWWRDEAAERMTLLFRPHPRDSEWTERYAAAIAAPGVGVQPASYTDMDDLATLLQHAAVVVTNAGTILLDALVNDRPAICVVYDEGAPPGARAAELNVLGAHYVELMESGAFPLAASFDDVVREIDAALTRPDERRAARASVAKQVLGVIDGQAVTRVVDAILETADP